jgi:hypothetical protein
MSTTNGWDAVCAMSLSQVNALLFQQYLRNGPTSPAMPLRLILNVETQYWILDVVLGPPELSFNADGQNATLAMELVRGSLIAFDPSQGVVQNAIRIRPKESRLTGPLSLAKVDVKDTLGSLVADLGATAYRPQVKGVGPDTVLNTTLGDAVQNYFTNNETRFPIGSVAPAQVPASLQPTDFKFAVQQKTGSSDACVLLLIQTNGPAGTVQPLDADDYPIPENDTAALRVSARALFNGVLVDYLNGAFSSFYTLFSGQQSGDTWSTVTSGGSFNFGSIGDPTNTLSFWSSDVNGNLTAVHIPLRGFAVSASQGSLSANWSCAPTHYWSYYAADPPSTSLRVVSTSVTLQVSYSNLGRPSVDPVSDQVTFAGSGTPSLRFLTSDDFVLNLFVKWGVQEPFVNIMQNGLQSALDSFQLPSVNTFALANLLFPADHALSLSGAALPEDLYLTGTMVTPIAVTTGQPPSSTANIAPGATAQFAAAVPAGDSVALWEINPKLGTISVSQTDKNTAWYTAPATIDEATVVVVTAVSQSDASQTGSAMVLVFESAAAQGVDVAPGSSVVTPGQKVILSCADSNGNPLAVTWTLSPKDFGQIAPPLLPILGQYIYTAPAKIDSATQVTATATNQANTAQIGSAVIQVTPTVTVTVAPSSPTVAPGATVQLTATVSAGDPDDLAWVVIHPPGVPSSMGKVVADPDDASKATYTAPNTAPNSPTNLQINVLAYLVDDEAAGICVVGITISS